MEEGDSLLGSRNITLGGGGEGQAGGKGKLSLFGKTLLKILSTIFMFKKGIFMITNWTFDILAGYFYLNHGSYEFVDWCGANTVGGNNTWSGHEHRNILIGSFNLSFLLMPFIFKVFFTLVSSCLQKKTKWNESLQSLFQCLWYLPFLSLFKFIGNVNMLREAKDLYRKVVRISYKMTDVADNCENMEELDALLGLTKDEKEVLKGAIEAENIELGYVGTKTDALTWTQRFKSLFRIEKDPNASNGQDQPDGDMKNQVKGKTSDQPKSKEKPAQTKNARTRTVSECPANKEKQKKEIDTEKKRRRINGYSAIQKEQEKAEKYISHLQSKVQAFNIYKAVLEDLPQTVMQLSVLANEGRIDGQLKTIISTIVLNMASTIIYFSRAYLMMPFQVDEKSKLNCPVQKPKESNQRRNRKSSIEMDELNSKQPDKKARDNGQNAKTEDPDPSKGAKRRRLKSESAENKKIEKHEKDPEQTQKMEKAPYKSIFNFPIVIICMIFIVTPRLLMVALWTSNRDLDLMPIPLIILAGYIIVCTIIAHFKWDGDEITCLGLYSAIFGPCIIRRPGTPFLRRTSLLSLVFHLLMSIHFSVFLRVYGREEMKIACLDIFRDNYIDIYILAFLLISVFFSEILQWFSIDYNRQLVGVQILKLLKQQELSFLSLAYPARYQFIITYKKAVAFDEEKEKTKRFSPDEENGLKKNEHTKTYAEKFTACFSRKKDKNPYDKILKKYLELNNKKILNCRDGFYRTVFHMACSSNDPRVYWFLERDYCIDENIPDRFGRSGLHRACMFGYAELVEKLLANPQIRLDIFDREGKSAFFKACETDPVSKKLRTDVIKVWFDAVKNEENDQKNFEEEKKSDRERKIEIKGRRKQLRDVIMASTNNGTTPFHMICSAEDGVEVAEEYLDLKNFEFFNKHLSFSINVTDNSGETGFHKACRKGHEKMVSFLLQKNPNLIKSKNSMLQTGFHLACFEGKSKVVEILAQTMSEEYLNAQDGLGNTGFHYACLNGKIGVVKILIDLVNIDIKNNEGGTPQKLASEKKRYNIIKYFVELNRLTKDLSSPEGLFQMACEVGDNEKDINAGNNQQATKIEHFRKLFEQVDEEIQKQGFLTVLSSDNLVLFENWPNLEEAVTEWKFGNKTAFHEACAKGSLRIVKFLLKKDKSFAKVLNNANENGFHLACLNNNASVVKFLRNNNFADVTLQNNTGKDAFTMACSRGHIRVIQLLLKNHQDIGDIVRLLSSKLNLKGVRQFKRIVARVIDENRKKRITIQHCQFLDGFKKACDAKVNDKASEKNQKEVIILLLKKISPENLKNICTEFQRQEKGVLLTLDFYRRRQRKFDKKIIYVDSLENPTKVEIK